MIWVETHKPKTFEEVKSHSEVVKTLRTYTLDTVPNLILHGQPGSNKRTLLQTLIGHLYGRYSEPTLKTVEMKVNSQTVVVSYTESDEMVEICPSDYGIKDRHVIQNIIKSMAETRPILSLFGAEKHSVKILLINRAEDLSRDAQAALRRTMELYSGHFRLFMVCTEPSKLIEPITSRSLFFRVRSFTDTEILDILRDVLEKEDLQVERNALDGIVKNSRGNCRRALCTLELYCFNQNESEFKKHKSSMSEFKLDWEIQIDKIVDFIKNKPKVENFVMIRKEFYSLLNSCIPAHVILLALARTLGKGNFDAAKVIAEFALVYDERIRLGSKHLFHLEAFAARAMCFFEQRK